jgi:hypothetical protein
MRNYVEQRMRSSPHYEAESTRLLGVLRCRKQNDPLHSDTSSAVRRKRHRHPGCAVILLQSGRKHSRVHRFHERRGFEAGLWLGSLRTR